MGTKLQMGPDYIEGWKQVQGMSKRQKAVLETDGDR